MRSGLLTGSAGLTRARFLFVRAHSPACLVLFHATTAVPLVRSLGLRGLLAPGAELLLPPLGPAGAALRWWTLLGMFHRLLFLPRILTETWLRGGGGGGEQPPPRAPLRKSEPAFASTAPGLMFWYATIVCGLVGAAQCLLEPPPPRGAPALSPCATPAWGPLAAYPVPELDRPWLLADLARAPLPEALAAPGAPGWLGAAGAWLQAAGADATPLALEELPGPPGLPSCADPPPPAAQRGGGGAPVVPARLAVGGVGLVVDAGAGMRRDAVSGLLRRLAMVAVATGMSWGALHVAATRQGNAESMMQRLGLVAQLLTPAGKIAPRVQTLAVREREQVLDVGTAMARNDWEYIRHSLADTLHNVLGSGGMASTVGLVPSGAPDALDDVFRGLTPEATALRLGRLLGRMLVEQAAAVPTVQRIAELGQSSGTDERTMSLWKSYLALESGSGGRSPSIDLRVSVPGSGKAASQEPAHGGRAKSVFTARSKAMVRLDSQRKNSAPHVDRLDSKRSFSGRRTREAGAGGAEAGAGDAEAGLRHCEAYLGGGAGPPLDSADWESLDHPPASLPYFAVEMFRRLGLVEHGFCEEETLLGFCRALQASYADHPYHNFFHAVGVAHFVYYQLRTCPELAFLGRWDRLGLMAAALGHDAGHRGVSNAFLCKVQDPLAVTYCFESVQEQMHTSVLLDTALTGPGCNIFAEAPAPVFEELVGMIRHSILRTDISRHFALIGEMEDWANEHPGGPGGRSALISDGGGGSQPPSPSPSLALGQPEGNKPLMCAVALHLADVGNVLKRPGDARRWAERVVDEFFLQGDRERELGLGVSPMMDREAVKVPDMQMGFIEFVVVPFLGPTLRLLPSLSGLAFRVADNYDQWIAQARDDAASAGQEPAESLSQRGRAIRSRVSVMVMRSQPDPAAGGGEAPAPAARRKGKAQSQLEASEDAARERSDTIGGSSVGGRSRFRSVAGAPPPGSSSLIRDVERLLGVKSADRELPGAGGGPGEEEEDGEEGVAMPSRVASVPEHRQIRLFGGLPVSPGGLRRRNGAMSAAFPAGGMAWGNDDETHPNAGSPPLDGAVSAGPAGQGPDRPHEPGRALAAVRAWTTGHDGGRGEARDSR